MRVCLAVWQRDGWRHANPFHPNLVIPLKTLEGLERICLLFSFTPWEMLPVVVAPFGNLVKQPNTLSISRPFLSSESTLLVPSTLGFSICAGLQLLP